MITIVSGGQTGVDRAALDAALAAGVAVRGWCPRGRKAEDGPIAEGYPLRETPTDDYAERTAWNVRDSDGTLVLTMGDPVGGTALTLQEVIRQRRPGLHVALEEEGRARAAALDRVCRWLEAEGVRALNVAGPRESESPGVYRRARAFVEALLERLTAVTD